MRNSEQIMADYRSLKAECMNAIVELIKKTGNDEYKFKDTFPSVAYWNGWGDGWQSEAISKISLNQRGCISLILSEQDVCLDFEDVHHAEWAYILEILEEELKNNE